MSTFMKPVDLLWDSMIDPAEHTKCLQIEDGDPTPLGEDPPPSLCWMCALKNGHFLPPDKSTLCSDCKPK